MIIEKKTLEGRSDLSKHRFYFQEKKTMVRKLVERADVLVERSHSFAPLIKDTCNRLDSGFNNFFQKIMRINNKEVCFINLKYEKQKLTFRIFQGN